MKANKSLLITVILCMLLVPVISLSWLVYRFEHPETRKAVERQKLVQELDGFMAEQPWQGVVDEAALLVTDLRTKEEELILREQSLVEREQRHQAEMAELIRVRSELEGLRRNIDSLMLTLSTEELNNLKPMAQMCSNLSPKASIAIMNELQEETAIKILRLMKEDVVTAIFEEMTKGAKEGSEPVLRAANWLEQLRLVRQTK